MLNKSEKPDVWKEITKRYVCRDLKRPNWAGSTRTVRYVNDVSWSVRIDGKVLSGLGTRKAAIAIWNDSKAG